MAIDKESFLLDKHLYHLAADELSLLLAFGYYLAEREGYKVHTGMDAVHFYLIQKYHWLPQTVRSLNHDDLWFLFREEMHGWTLPGALCDPSE